jgi:glycosyltransferase involved in cell wall biosynthesis
VLKILHMTTLHPAEDLRILGKECRTLAGDGYDVQLAARVPSEVMIDGISVIPIGPSEVETGLPKLARRLLSAWRAARRAGASLYHLHDPELIPVGLLLKLRGARVVYDAHEDTPLDLQSLGDVHWRARVLARAYRAANRLAGRRFDAIVAATPGVARSFPAEKTIVARNFPLTAEAGAFVGPRHRERRREVIYIGRISQDRGAREMTAAATMAGATLILAGPGRQPFLDAMRQEAGWASVDYRGWLSREEIATALQGARAGLVVLHPRKAYLESLPVKLFEYMAAGIPVIASDFPLWRSIVAGAGCGVLVDPADPAAIATAIERLLGDPDEAEEMGRRGREAVRETYNWERESRQLLERYALLLRDRA